MATGTSTIDYSLLKDRSIIITGGASGLGFATATKMAEHGAYVTIADIQEGPGQDAASDLTSRGGKVTFAHCDTTDWESSLSAFKHAVNFSPSKTLDVAILYAGISGEGKSLVDLVLQGGGEPSLTSDPTRPTHRALDVNLTGQYISAYLALHYFRLPSSAPTVTNGATDGHTPALADFKKSLVLISSLAGYLDLPYNTLYATSKFAIRGMFRSLRRTSATINVRTNLIAPGYVQTPLSMKYHKTTSSGETSSKTGSKIPWAPIEYVVEAACSCAIDDAVHGRAFAIMPVGWVDLDEDIDKDLGGPKLVELLRKCAYPL